MSNQRKISFRKLRNIIVDLYPTEVSQRRIAQDAGLNLKQINISGSPVDAWNAILTEAENATMMYALLEVVCSPDEYGTKVELRTACDNYLASIAESGELPPVGPPAKTIPGWFLLVGRLLVVITFVYLFIAFVLRDQLGHRERFLFILAVALTGGGSAFFLGAWAKGNEIISIPIFPDDYISFGIVNGLLIATILLATTFINMHIPIPPEQPPTPISTPRMVVSPDASTQVVVATSSTVPTSTITATVSETATPLPQPTNTPPATMTAVPVGTTAVTTAMPSPTNLLTPINEPPPTIISTPISVCPTIAPYRVITSTIDNMPMVCIPAGVFTRGNNNGAADEQPETQIDLDEFYIDQYEVTNRMYRECVTARKCTTPENPSTQYNSDGYDDYPIVNVTWNQARQYCEDFRRQRLPTESEWEKAARGPEEYLYPWGNTMTDALLKEFRDRKTPVRFDNTPIDRSSYGVYNMAGNVREWVNDYYGQFYYRASPTSNPQGPEDATRRVVRGGSWSLGESDFFWSTTKRQNFQTTSSTDDIGFRCATDKPFD